MLVLPLIEGTRNTVETTINDVVYQFTTNWNDRFGYYSMDIVCAGETVASGVVLVSGVDIVSVESIPLERMYCINKIDITEDFGYSGLGDDGMVVLIEDSDLE